MVNCFDIISDMSEILDKGFEINENRVLEILIGNPMSANQIANTLGIKSKPISERLSNILYDFGPTGMDSNKKGILSIALKRNDPHSENEKRIEFFYFLSLEAKSLEQKGVLGELKEIKINLKELAKDSGLTKKRSQIIPPYQNVLKLYQIVNRKNGSG